MPPSAPHVGKEPRARSARVFPTLFLLVGVACLVFASVKLVRTASLLRSGAGAVGTVVDFHASRGSKSTTYAPEVSFLAPDGRLIRFRSRLSSGSPDYAVGQRVPVLYSPDHPEDAEIDGFLPLWLPVILLSALGLAFAAAGGGLLAALRHGARNARLEAEALERGLEQWQADPAWNSGAVRSVTRQEMWFFWVFAVCWNAVSLPLVFVLPHEIAVRGNRLAAVGLLFPVVGCGLLWAAARRALQLRRFGELLLRMDPFPGSLGGEVGGVVELPIAFRPANDFAVTLGCLHVTKSRNGTREEPVWQEEGRAGAAPGSEGTQVAFRFAVPAGLPPTGGDPSRCHRWTVRLTAELPGLDLDRSFVIPVVAEEAPRASGLSVPLAPDLEPAREIPPGTARVERQPGRLALHYGARRNGKNGLVVGFVGGWFLFFTWLFTVKGAGPALIILPFFGLVGVGLALYAVWLFGYTLTVEVDTAEVVAVRRFLGVPVTTARAAVTSVQDVEAVRAGARGSGIAARLLFTLKARLSSGEYVTVGDGIEGRRTAETLARLLLLYAGRGARETADAPRPAVAPRAAFAVDPRAGGGDTMTCPKCGALQPAAPVCASCQVIVAKARRRQERPPASAGPQGAGRLLGLALLAVGVACLVAWTMGNRGGGTAKTAAAVQAGRYRNDRYHFAMAVPPDWKILTVQEAIACSTLRDDYADQYLLLASPSTPQDCLLVVDIAGVSLESFRSNGWEAFVAEVGSRNPVRFSEVAERNGLTVHRVAYEVAGYYREDVYFEAGNTLLELYFYVPNGADTADRVRQLRGLVDANLRRL